MKSPTFLFSEYALLKDQLFVECVLSSTFDVSLNFASVVPELSIYHVWIGHRISCCLSAYILFLTTSWSPRSSCCGSRHQVGGGDAAPEDDLSSLTPAIVAWGEGRLDSAKADSPDFSLCNVRLCSARAASVNKLGWESPSLDMASKVKKAIYWGKRAKRENRPERLARFLRSDACFSTTVA